MWPVIKVWNINAQTCMNNFCDWTEKNKKKLYEQKSKIMVFKFTTNYQCSTRVTLNDNLLDRITDTRFMGTVISSDMKWQKNSNPFVPKRISEDDHFKKPVLSYITQNDLVLIYTLYLNIIQMMK